MILCVYVYLPLYKYIYICCWNGRPCHFPSGFLFNHGCHREAEVSAAKIIIQVLLPTVIILAGIKN